MPGHSDRGRRRDDRRRRVRPRRDAPACRCSVRCRRGCRRSPLPWISLADLGPIVIGGCAVALVSFADTSVLSRDVRRATAHAVDPNQEMVGLGAANLAAGFFQGFPISSSSSRTPVAEAAGAKTQLTGVVGALAVAAAAARRAGSAEEPAEQRARRGRDRLGDRPVRGSPICGASTASSVGSSGCRSCASSASRCSARSPASARDRDRGRRVPVGRLAPAFGGAGARRWREGYHDITRYPDARRIPGLVLFRWDAPLFFANAELFHERVLDAVAASPTPVRGSSSPPNRSPAST